MSSVQPLTITIRSSLNGSDIVTGETIIMPIARRMFETMMSIAMNGRYTRKPIWNALVSSETQKDGMRMQKLSGSTFAGSSGSFAQRRSAVLTKNARSRSDVWEERKARNGSAALARASVSNQRPSDAAAAAS